MMKPTLALIIFALLCVSACSREPQQSQTPAQQLPSTPPEAPAIPEDAVVLNFRVTGMHCDGCANALKGKLALLEGVYASDASFGSSSAMVTATDPAVADRVLATFAEMNYDGELVQKDATPAEGNSN